MIRVFMLSGLSLLAFVSFAAEQPSPDFSAVPLLVPPYPEIAFRSRLEGQVQVLIRFENSKPVLVELARSELRFVRSDQEVSPEPENIVARSVHNSLLLTLKEWRSEFVKDYEAVVKINYRTDPSLGRYERSYLVRRGRFGEVEGITITGPRIENP